MRLFLRILYSSLLFGAGFLHFLHESSFRRIVPKALPFRKFIVLASGMMEITFAILLWVKKGQQITSKFLALFMIAVFPANVYMAIKKIAFKPGEEANSLVLWLRLPLQIPLIIGALKVGRTDEEAIS